MEGTDMELLSTELTAATMSAEAASRLGSWATGNWWVDKFYDPNVMWREVHIDYTTEGFSKAALVPLDVTTREAA